MKTINYIMLLLLGSIVLASCNKDGDLMFLSSPEGGELTATATDVVLTKAEKSTVVFSLAWTKSTLEVSDANVSAPNVLQTTLQASASEDFSDTIVTSTETSLSKAYTGSELNTLAKTLKLTADNAAPVYFRLCVKTGDNMTPVYSNTEAVNITPYTINMNVGYVLDKTKTDTVSTLYSATANGVYTGFLGAAGWWNFYLLEGDDTRWGNVGTDGTEFQCTSDQDTQWNFWFPGQKGCYYTIVDTKEKEWSALYISALTVSGDLSGEMTYDKDNNKWTYDFTATTAGNINVKMSGTGAQYNVNTGTDDTKAVSTTVGFAGTSSNVTFGTSASDITVNVPAAGNYSLTLNLINPKAWTCTAETPSAPEKTLGTYLYVSGADDGISGGWTFDNYLTLYNEDNQTYEGVMSVNSLSGYRFYPTKDDWSTYYATADGTAASGALVLSGSNIPAPTAGLYLMDVDMKNLTYAIQEVTSVSVVGFNTAGDEGGDWNTLIPMTATSTAGEYATAITLAGTCSWGAKIYINGLWNYAFGGSDGTLTYQGNGFEAAKGAGTYTLTVNLKTLSYTME